jgi:hypothetical protein
VPAATAEPVCMRMGVEGVEGARAACVANGADADQDATAAWECVGAGNGAHGSPREAGAGARVGTIACLRQGASKRGRSNTSPVETSGLVCP